MSMSSTVTSLAQSGTTVKGEKVKQSRGALLIANLPALQNLIKRDPVGYKEEFLIQWNQFNSLYQILVSGSATASTSGASTSGDVVAGGSSSRRGREIETKFRELVNFVSQCAPSYQSMTLPHLSQAISELLLDPSSTLSHDTVHALIGALVLLRNRDCLNGIDFLKILFPLLSLNASGSSAGSSSAGLSKSERGGVLKIILRDVRNANKTGKNHRLNRLVQGLLFEMVQRGLPSKEGVQGHPPSRRGEKRSAEMTGREALWAVRLASELWRRQVWTDAKTVSIIEAAVFHHNVKVQSAALHFFLSSGSPDEATSRGWDSDDDSDEGPDIRQVKHRLTINKKTKSNERQAKEAIKLANKKRKRKDAAASATANFSAIHLMNDPQGFVDKLYDVQLLKSDKVYPLEHKIVIMQLLARVTSSHKLHVLGFYSYLIKYLTHHQLNITQILVALAQSVHDLTPPDVLEPVVRKLAAEFVHPGVAAEVIAAGLNAITEICRRQPWCMEKDLLEDLVEYRKSRDKGVMVASRSLLSLYREVNPGLLRKRERGKTATMTMDTKTVLQYGHDRTSTTAIEGLELLEHHLQDKLAEGGADNEGENSETGWQDWEAESASDVSSGGWVAVSDGEDDIELSESDTDVHVKRRKETPKRTEASDVTLVQLSQPAAVGELGNLATTKILTPADFAKLAELRLAAAEQASKANGPATRKQLAQLQEDKKAKQDAEFLSEGDIIGVQKKAKANYEERLAMIKEGREGRAKFGSSKGKKNSTPSSSTNEEKRKKKNYVMMVNSRDIKGKKFSSLADKQKKLRGHITRQKKGGRRGNK